MWYNIIVYISAIIPYTIFKRRQNCCLKTGKFRKVFSVIFGKGMFINMKYKNENEERAEQNESGVEPNSITDTGIISTPNAKHLIHCLTIIGQIEGHYILPPQTKTTKYEHIIPALVAIEQDRNIEGLLFSIPLAAMLRQVLRLRSLLREWKRLRFQSLWEADILSAYP